MFSGKKPSPRGWDYKSLRKTHGRANAALLSETHSKASDTSTLRRTITLNNKYEQQ